MSNLQSIRNSTSYHYNCFSSDENNNNNNSKNSSNNGNYNDVENVMKNALNRKQQEKKGIYCLIYGELSQNKIKTWTDTINDTIKKRKRKREINDNDNDGNSFINVNESFNIQNTKYIVIDKTLYNCEEKRNSLLKKINEETKINWRDFHQIRSQNIELVDIDWIYECLECLKDNIVADHSKYVIHI